MASTTRTLVPNSTVEGAVLREARGSAAYWAVYVAVALIGLVISLFAEPSRFADFDTYVYYLDGLVHFPPPSWMYFEVSSNLYLLAAHWLTRSVLSAVVLAHYVLGIVFLLALPVIYPPRRVPWPALLFTLAVMGPLLAFVTLRATPAYFLVAVAVRCAVDRRLVTWVYLAVAASFHISALLAALPLALLYFDRNLPALLRSDRSRLHYLLLTFAIIIGGVLLPQLSGSLISLIKSIPVLSKYDVYTVDNESAVTQIGHYIFLAFAIMLTVVVLALQREAERKLGTFVLSSFALYVLMFFSASPVAAFRQTPFWMITMIAALPWDRLGVRRATVPLFVLACAALMVFQFSQVYDRAL